MQSLRGAGSGCSVGSTARERSEYQGLLESILLQLFPSHNILANTRKHVDLRSPETGVPLEIDVWIPELQLAFEYQDPHHYISYWYANPTVHHTQLRDNIKKRLLLERGETLIVVPCWWDGTPVRLAGTIQTARPDLLSTIESHADNSNLIPCNPPRGFFKGIGIPIVGELMLASFNPSSEFNHSSWWLSEKYDGFRFCWHPDHKCMYSRFGVRHNFLARYISPFLPDSYLDGEIWFGRETFEEAQSLMSQDQEALTWENLRFVVFDSPNPSLDSTPFEQRYAILLADTTVDSPVIPAMNKYLLNRHHLTRYTKLILQHGGEGVVVREPKSLYHRGKSPSLVKYKAFRDSEALIVDVVDNQFTMQLTDGTVFVVGTSHDNTTVHTVIPKRGDIVTFSYSHLSGEGLPHGVRMLRVRRDITWELIVAHNHSHADENYENSLATQIHAPARGQKPNGYWTNDENVRSYFDSFALAQGKDPLAADTWYGYKSSDLPTGIASIVSIHGSYSNAVKHAYPEIQIEEINFKRKSTKFWSDRSNVREFFDKFATNAKFDPLLVDNWYHITATNITDLKHGYSVLSQYNHVHFRAIMAAYPELMWDDRKFKRQYQFATMPMSARKAVLDSIACSRGFDPLIARNWYSISCADIFKQPGGASLLRHYNGGLIRTLTHVYPTIGLDPVRFKKVALQYRMEPNNLKDMVDAIAKRLGFEPEITANWYTVTAADVIKHKGGTTLLKHFKSIPNLVSAVYPETAKRHKV